MPGALIAALALALLAAAPAEAVNAAILETAALVLSSATRFRVFATS